MLRRMTAQQFQGWMDMFEIERFGEAREDARVAYLAATIWNVVRDKKSVPLPYELGSLLHNFLQEMGEIEAAPQRQTLEEKKAMARLIVEAFNGKRQ